jgi:MerR family transcriptional regulator, mercuric resistance operon regulatory protein
MTIGKVAELTGLTPDALRYYERRGLIEPPQRTSGGFRLYGEVVLRRLRFLKQAQRQGWTLAEIRDLLRLDTAGELTPCQQVQQLLDHKIADLDARLAELQEFRRTLKAQLGRCARTLAEAPDAACPVVDDLREPAR